MHLDRWKGGRLRALGVLVGALLLAVSPAQPKDYRVDLIQVDAFVRSDGSVRIVEKRVYSFRGSFSWADYRLPLRGIGRVDSVRVWEGDTEYRPDSSGEPGTFEMLSTAEEVRILWHFKARNQTRVFHLAFVVPGLVKVHEDIAELYYRFIGAGSRKRVEEAMIRIHWAETPVRDSIRVWLHGVDGRIQADSTSTVTVLANRVEPDRFLEVRAVFPTSCVPAARGFSGLPALERILREEAEWARRMEAQRRALIQEREARRQRQLHVLWFLGFLSVAGIAIVLNFWFNFGKPHHVSGVPRLLSQPASDRKPALVAYLLRRNDFGPEVFVATLFDLVRRGFIELKVSLPAESEGKDSTFVLRLPERRPEGDRLDAWEQDLLDFLFRDLASGSRILTQAEFKAGRRKIRRWFTAWRKKVMAAGRKEGIFEPTSLVARNKALAVAITLMVTGFVFTVVVGWTGLIPLLVGAGLFLFAFSMVRRSLTAQEELLRWKAFGRYLRRLSGRKPELTELARDLRDRAWIYGMVLGIAGKRFRRLTERLFGTRSVEWLSPSPAASLASVAGALVSAVGGVSSAAGVGAGATGGGAGGAVGGAG